MNFLRTQLYKVKGFVLLRALPKVIQHIEKSHTHNLKTTHFELLVQFSLTSSCTCSCDLPRDATHMCWNLFRSSWSSHVQAFLY